jgi:hypothetical protein
MDKGIIWDISKGYPAHVISWHELTLPKLGNVRVWIHSKGHVSGTDFNYGGGKSGSLNVFFTFGSMEIQSHGETFHPVTEQEKQARIQLANLSPQKSNGELKSSLFRELPVGQLEVDHMKCIKACYDQDKFESKNKVRIVSSEKTPSIVFKSGKFNSKSSYEGTIESELTRATHDNAIALAKLYSDLSRIGVQKIIKQISVDTGLESKNIYTALRVARAKGWLSSEGVGKSGGFLTEEGAKVFEKLGGQKLIDSYFKSVGGNR